MKSVDLQELKRNLIRYLEEASRGGSFLLTLRDQPIAVLEPPPKGTEGKVPIPEALTGEIAGYFNPATGRMDAPEERGKARASRERRLRRP